MNDLFAELAKLPAGTLTVLVAIIAATGVIASAMITAVLSRLFLLARDRQDREVEWRKHAIELTKLELERKLKTRLPAELREMRPVMLDFLANYSDLQKLGKLTPAELYLEISAVGISKRPQAATQPDQQPKVPPPQ